MNADVNYVFSLSALVKYMDLSDILVIDSNWTRNNVFGIQICVRCDIYSFMHLLLHDEHELLA